VRCSGVHVMYIDRVMHVGDVYHTGHVGVPLHFAAGVHTVHLRVRAKATANFGCFITPVAGITGSRSGGGSKSSTCGHVDVFVV
jgi:hypothetical protein